MKKLPVQFRCYAEYDDDVKAWVAACVDLCLAAQADTLEEAKKKLHEQVLDYLQDAVDTGSFDEAMQMLSRRAPLTEMAKYKYLRFKEFLNFHTKEGSIRYKEKTFPRFFAAS